MMKKRSRHQSSLRCAVMLAWAAGVAGWPGLRAHAEPFDVPAISTPATGVHLAGKLIWLDLETTDLPGAQRFYRALFGWDYRHYHAFGVDYTVALANGKPVAGMVRRRIVNQTERRSAWLAFFSVPDVNAAWGRALGAHAAVRSEPENVPLRGRQARLVDPEGAVFALVTSSSGDPTDDPNPRAFGTWGAPSLLARDPAGEAVFYQALFGYSVQGAPTDRGFERIRLSAGTYARAEVRRLPGDPADWHPQWISFVRVFNAADTAQQAVELGGHVLVATTRATTGAPMTLLADPSGAVFGVVELPPEIVGLPTR